MLDIMRIGSNNDLKKDYRIKEIVHILKFGGVLLAAARN